MSTTLSSLRHVRGFDVMRPLSIATLVGLMLPLLRDEQRVKELLGSSDRTGSRLCP
jgi:hypothetical protein